MERYDITPRANTHWGLAVKKQLLLKPSYYLGSHWKKKNNIKYMNYKMIYAYHK